MNSCAGPWLKGGTALNAFHIGLKRLSVDIDLQYIGPLAGDALRPERNEVDEALSRILESQARRIKRQKHGPDGTKWEAHFNSALGGGSRLKIDLGYLDRLPLFGSSRMSSVDLGGWKATDVLVLDLNDVVAGKLSALTQRTLPRDIFDAMSIAEIEDHLDMASIRAAFLALVAASRNGWEGRGIGALAGDPHEICQDLLHCLPSHHIRGKDATVAWYYESIGIARERFGNLLEPTPRERRFVEIVQTRGKIRADLLDAPADLRNRITESPRLAWKCRMVKARNISDHSL